MQLTKKGLCTSGKHPTGLQNPLILDSQKQAHLPVTKEYACFYYITYLFYIISFTCHAMYAVLLSYCLKCLIQIFDDIVNVFSTDRKTDGVRVDALLFQFFLCQLSMSSRSWMDNQRLNICYICK